MKNPYKRKKQPDLVRKKLLKVAASIAIEEGMRSLTLDRVAHDAGVSKGGLLHHFKNRAILLESMADSIVDEIDEAVDAKMAEDPNPTGRFARAYLHVMTDIDLNNNEMMHGLFSLVILVEPDLRYKWEEWLEEALEKHNIKESDHAMMIRLAADGLWLSSLFNEPNQRNRALVDYLIQLTYKEEQE